SRCKREFAAVPSHLLTSDHKRRASRRVSMRQPEGRATSRGSPTLTRQSDNVPFEQSRNVLLTAPSFGDAGRTTTDDPGRSRPAGDVEKSQGETDYAARGG